MNKLLSILIPAYNCQNTLSQCLESIINQSAFSDNVDILVINDGSKDNTGEVINLYQAKCPQIRSITRSNKGIGPTRNELLDNAIGEYFWFVDSDDFISNDSLSIILKNICDRKLDLLMFGYNIINQNEICKTYRYSGFFNNAIDLTNQGIFNNSLWTRVYKLSVVNNAHIRFNSYVMAEDFDFIFRLIPKIAKCACVDTIIYNYVMTPHSATQEKGFEHRLRVANDSLECIMSYDGYFENLDLTTQKILKHPFNANIIAFIYSIMDKTFDLNYKRAVFKRLSKAGFIPIDPLPESTKRKVFCFAINSTIIRNLYLLYSQYISR